MGHEWPTNTILFAGDSMYNNIDESRLSLSRKFNVKVRSHPGATVGDMKHHLTALLRKKPSYIVIHAGANDAPDESKSAEDIVGELMDLKKYVQSILPSSKVIISCPIVRKDNNHANVKVIHIRALLRTSGATVITNDNISVDLLGKKGLHLTNKGVGRLASNMIEFLKSL